MRRNIKQNRVRIEGENEGSRLNCRRLKPDALAPGTHPFCFSIIPYPSTLIPELMYVILVYDMNVKRVGKMLKLCRRYLNWVQNSVFEGEISEVKLKELLHQARKQMNEEEDSIILFKNRDLKFMEKEIVGVEKASTDNFL